VRARICSSVEARGISRARRGIAVAPAMRMNKIGMLVVGLIEVVRRRRYWQPPRLKART
jgi:hypothetical protein